MKSGIRYLSWFINTIECILCVSQFIDLNTECINIIAFEYFMYKVDPQSANYYFNNQQEQYYGYNRSKATRKSKNTRYDQNQNPNIIEEDSSKEMGTVSNKINNSGKKFSKAKSERGVSPSSSFYSSSNLRERIEKACPTNNPSDLKKQIMLLRKEVERLERELLKKDKQILESKNAVMPTKQNQNQIMELYRIVNYYEGKIKEMESEIVKFRDLILKIDSSSGVKPEELNIIFQDLTNQNENIAGRYEELQFQKNMMENKYKKLESKYHEAHRELLEYKRKQQDPLNKNNTERAQYMYELLKSQPNNLIAKQQYYNLQAYSARIQQLQQDYQRMRSQNQVLKTDLQAKINQITALHKEYIQVKKSLKSFKTIEDNKSCVGSQGVFLAK